MNQVVAKLKSMITKIKNDYNFNPELSNEQTSKLNDYNTFVINDLIHGGSSQVIQNFDQMNIESKTLSDEESILFEKNLSMVIDEIVELIFKEENNGIGSKIRHRHVFDYFNSQNVTSQEIFNWLLNNQNDSNSIFLLGYFNYYGIETSKDKITY